MKLVTFVEGERRRGRGWWWMAALWTWGRRDLGCDCVYGCSAERAGGCCEEEGWRSRWTG